MMRRFNPKVSIIIPVYNGSNYVKEAIDSALQQTYDNSEVIVINDGSNDGEATAKICRLYGNKIRYFEKENGGVASALNMGIEKMEGEYFSWLSHDDVYYPDKLEVQIKELSKLEDKGTIVYTNVEYINDKSETISKTEYEKIYSEKSLNTGIFPVLKGLTNGCSLLIAKKCFNEVGVFNEELKTSNDYEMWFRLFKKYPSKFVSKIIIKYRFHDQQGTKLAPVSSRVRESDKVWNTAIRELNEKDIKLFGESVFPFFWNLAYQMKVDSRRTAYSTALEKARKYYERVGPEVSIIMPVFNSGKYISDAIESILSQTYVNWELLVIDDGSSDNSVSIAEKYRDKDFRIKVAKNHNFKGVAGAMNTGLEMSKANKYITRMDSDDISVETRLKKQVLFLDNNKEYGFCSVNMSAFGSMEVPFLFKKPNVPLEWLFLWSNPMASAATMYDAKILRKYRIKFRNYKVASDYDFLCQVLLYAKPYMLYDESLYKYRIYKESIFQSNRNQAMSNSIEINEALIKSLGVGKVPEFHKILTPFYFEKNDNIDFKISELEKWTEKLAQVCNKRWKWKESDYLLVIEDSEKRIKESIVSLFGLDSDIANKNERLKSLESDIQSLRQQLELIQSEYESLKTRSINQEREFESVINSKSWRITKPLRVTSKAVGLFVRSVAKSKIRDLIKKK